MESQELENKKAVKENQKIACRQQALQMAERINPSELINYGQQLGQRSAQKPSVDTLLKDADKIYEWLIKDL